MPPVPDPASSLAPRTIRLLEILLVVLLWNGAYKGVRVLNTLFALELGAQPITTGLLLATYGLLPLVLAVPAGRIGDRYGVRLPVAAGLIVCTIGILLPYLAPVLPALFIAAAVTGAGFLMVQVSLQYLVGSLAPGAARTRNMNLYALAVSSADLAGPVFTGFSIDAAGYLLSYLWLGAWAAAAAIVFGCYYRRVPAAAAAAGRREQRMTDLLRDPPLRRMLLASAVIVAGVDVFQLYLPLYGHSIGLSATAIGMILGAFACAAFVSRALIPALARRFGEEPTLVYSMGAAAATFLLIPFFGHATALAAVCFALGLGMGLGQPLTIILTYNYSPRGRAGEALGLRIAIINTMHVSVPALAGAAGSLVGLAPVFWFSSVILAGGGWAVRMRRAD